MSRSCQSCCEPKGACHLGSTPHDFHSRSSILSANSHNRISIRAVPLSSPRLANGTRAAAIRANAAIPSYKINGEQLFFPPRGRLSQCQSICATRALFIDGCGRTSIVRGLTLHEAVIQQQCGSPDSEPANMAETMRLAPVSSPLRVAAGWSTRKVRGSATLDGIAQ